LYKIIEAVKAGKNGDDQKASNLKKVKQTFHAVAAVQAAVDWDHCITVHEIRLATDLTTGTIYSILTTNLGLVKKSVRWIPKLLNWERGRTTVRTLCGSTSGPQKGFEKNLYYRRVGGVLLHPGKEAAVYEVGSEGPPRPHKFT